MARTVLPRVFLTASLWAFYLTISKASECTYTFKFWDLNSTFLTPEIDTSIYLNFSLNASSVDCGLPENLRIFIRRHQDGLELPMCILHTVNGTLRASVNNNSICRCEEKWCDLSKKVNETDYTEWVWETNNANVTPFTINITNPSGFSTSIVTTGTTGSADKDEGRNTRLNEVSPDQSDNRKNEEPSNDTDQSTAAEIQLDSSESSAQEQAVIKEERPHTDIYMVMLGLAFAVAASLAVGIFVYYRFCKGNQEHRTGVSKNVSKKVQGISGLAKQAGERTSRCRSSLMRKLSSRTGRRTESQTRSDVPSAHIYWELEDEPDTKVMICNGGRVEEGDDAVMIINSLYQGQKPASRVASLGENDYEEIAVPAQTVAMGCSSRSPAFASKHASNSLTKKGLTRKLASLSRRPSAKCAAPPEEKNSVTPEHNRSTTEAPKPGAAYGDYVTVDDMAQLYKGGEQQNKNSMDSDKPGAAPGDYVSLSEALQLNKQDK